MYIVYGMTYEQFWFGDPWMAKYYREAHLLKRKMTNEELWINGLYAYHAFGAVIATAFGKKREEYVKKPFNIFTKSEIEKREDEREQKHKLIAMLNLWGKSAKKKTKAKYQGVDQDA